MRICTRHEKNLTWISLYFEYIEIEMLIGPSIGLVCLWNLSISIKRDSFYYY